MLLSPGISHILRAIARTSIILLVCFSPSHTRPATAQNNSEIIGIKYDSLNKQGAVGFVRIGVTWGQLFEPPGITDRAITHLKDAMNKYTGIVTVEQNHVELAARNIHELPILFVMSYDLVELTPTERENLKEYIKNGGLVVADTDGMGRATPDTEAGDPFRKMLREIVPNARFSPIPDSDPIYHCFFDFNDGPPGTEKSTYAPYLEGVYHNGRLVAIYSNKGYGRKWHSHVDAYLKMGVNMIVFAMIQEGSIAKQY